jgi:hypothetical protein
MPGMQLEPPSVKRKHTLHGRRPERENANNGMISVDAENERFTGRERMPPLHLTNVTDFVGQTRAGSPINVANVESPGVSKSTQKRGRCHRKCLASHDMCAELGGRNSRYDLLWIRHSLA